MQPCDEALVDVDEAAFLAPEHEVPRWVGLRLWGRGRKLRKLEPSGGGDSAQQLPFAFLLRRIGHVEPQHLAGGLERVVPERLPLRPFPAELDRSGRAERLELDRLGRRELAELLDRDRRAGRTGAGRGHPGPFEGNPFFAEELLAAHQEGTKLPLALRDLLLAWWRRCRSRPSGCWRWRRWPAPGWTTSCWRPAGQDTEELVGLLREAVTRHVLGSTRPAAPTCSATPWSRRRFHETCWCSGGLPHAAYAGLERRHRPAATPRRPGGPAR